MGLEILSVIFFPLKLRKNSHNLLKKAPNLDLMVHKMSSFANLLITLLILWPGSCTSELYRIKYGLARSRIDRPAQILFYNSLSAVIHLYMIRPYMPLFKAHLKNLSLQR